MQFEFFHNTPSRTLGWDFTLIPTITLSWSPRIEGARGVCWALMFYWLFWDVGVTYIERERQE